MEDIKIRSHEFVKQNNVTITRGNKSYDLYKCKHCGLEGKRYGLTEFISVTRNKVSCPYYKKKLQEESDALNNCQKVKVIDSYPCQSFGFKLGAIYDRVECPESEKDDFGSDIWIYSEVRKEPVRLLNGEYEIIKE